MRQTIAAVRMLLVLTVITGVAYPAVVWAVGRVAFAEQAEGSFTEREGVVVASTMIGQHYSGDAWFHGRPSAGRYDALASGGSNLGPENTELVASIEQRRAQVAARESVGPSDVPVDAVTASASGLDPFISEEYAALQMPRVAAARDLGETEVEHLVADATSGRTLGFLGQPRVNVVELNLALAAAPTTTGGARD
ncbi:MAG: potassium-transporting ATPase subunit KdpC [Nocardioidaceae bacterium]